MLSQMEMRNGGHAAKALSNLPTELPPTLSDIGLTRDQSSRYQQLASMSDEHFEAAVETAKNSTGEVTTDFTLREAAFLRVTQPGYITETWGRRVFAETALSH
ncbi:MAG: hypothetical protein Q8L65_10275 [Burkholderiales bacterium]|nr:hypothetical protein [Burkholderiales bacterium]MDP2398095.1 hypothetical protein [Burkholderiales bacterium]